MVQGETMPNLSLISFHLMSLDPNQPQLLLSISNSTVQDKDKYKTSPTIDFLYAFTSLHNLEEISCPSLAPYSQLFVTYST